MDKENVRPKEADAGEESTDDQNEEEKLDDAELDVLGEDPSTSRALEFQLPKALANRWNHFVANGIPKEEQEKLLEKYARKEGFDGPALNQEILTVLSESAQKRDAFLTEIQKVAGSILMALGAAIACLLNEQESIDKLSFLEYLSDAAKLATSIFYKQNESRKAFILPGMTKQVKDLLSKTKSDTFLFGKGLSELIKESKALEKIGPKTVYPQRAGSRSQGYSGNFRGPQGRRPFQNQAGYSQSNIQGRPRLSFRSRQPFNSRGQSSKYKTKRGK